MVEGFSKQDLYAEELAFPTSPKRGIQIVRACYIGHTPKEQIISGLMSHSARSRSGTSTFGSEKRGVVATSPRGEYAFPWGL
jgi:hypothetical protein